MSQLSDLIRQELEQYIDPVKREYLPRFFKTGKGQYGEGDKFLGVVVPHARKVAKLHPDASMEVIGELLQSEWHECRLCALLILVERFKKGDDEERKAIFRFYLSHTGRINNWDLVDLSAPAIVGEFLNDHPEERGILYQLACSSLLWDNRIAVVSTLTFIRNHDFIDILRLAEGFVAHSFAHDAHALAHDAHVSAHKAAHVPLTNAHSFAHDAHVFAHTLEGVKGVPPLHDLMQKAVGWMLREVGKRDEDLLVQFLEKYSRQMPRTMLRYAIEKFPEEQRKEFMKR